MSEVETETNYRSIQVNDRFEILRLPVSYGICTLDRKTMSVRKHYCALGLELELRLG